MDNAKQSATDAFKTASKRAIRAKVTGDLICNKIVNKITKAPKHSEAVTNEHDKEIPKKVYIFRRMTRSYWRTKMKIII